jgi:hypothetical protein
MSPEQTNDLKLRIYLNVEACCRKRGLIKKQNGYETYEEGLEYFINKQVNEIYKIYQKEKTGGKKPFFAGPKGIEMAIDIACNNRINDFIRNKCLQRIYQRLSLDEYQVSIQGDFEHYNSSNSLQVDVARSENISRFGEPVKGYDQSPESVFEEAQLKEIFDREHEKLFYKGKDGPLYYKVIQFYLSGFNENLRKRDEILALSLFLGVNRTKAIEIKCRALKFLFQRLSESFDLGECKKIMRHKVALEKRFKKNSIKKLLEFYDTRNSLFLDPYVGQKIACTIWIWSIFNGNRREDPDS